MDKNQPRYLFTSDWHTQDFNALRYDNRPFKNADHQDRELVKRFNSVARPQDTTYFLGDLGRGINDIIPRLNGTKILVFGNHDHLGVYSALASGFSAAIYSGSIRIGKNLVTFSHCPLRGIFREDVTGMKGAAPGEKWHGESRHGLFSIQDHGQFHIHGHTHSDPQDVILDKQLDVGVMGHNFFPVTISYIESWIAKASKGTK